MHRAVFLDRDGIINFEDGWLNHRDDFRLIEKTALAIKKFKDAGFTIVVVTNQGGIELDKFTEEDLAGIHHEMQSQLHKREATVDDILYCKHYHASCACRKPNPGMLYAAALKWELDLSRSFLIGDRITDKRAGDRAGCQQSYMIMKNAGIPSWIVEEIINS